MSSVKWQPFCLGLNMWMIPCGVMDLFQNDFEQVMAYRLFSAIGVPEPALTYFRSTIQCKANQNGGVFFRIENEFWNVICNISAILCRHQWLEISGRHTYMVCMYTFRFLVWLCEMILGIIRYMTDIIVVSLLMRLTTIHLVSSKITTVDDFTALALCGPSNL